MSRHLEIRLGGVPGRGAVGDSAPGKEADIALIRTTDVNTVPGTNAVATVTAFAHAGNVDTVLVAGQVRKWRGELTGHDMNAVAAQVLASRDYLFAASGQRADILNGVGTSRQLPRHHPDLPGGRIGSVGQATRDGESPGDGEQENERESEDERRRPGGAETKAGHRPGAAGAGERPVQAAVAVPGLHARGEQHHRAQHHGGARAQYPRCGGWGAAVVGVAGEADHRGAHRGAHRGQGGGERQMAEYPLQAGRRFRA